MDELDNTTLKLNAAVLCGPIRHVVNLSTRSSRCCNKWKIGRVVALHKGGKLDKYSPASYKPISILPAFSRIAEKAMQEQLNDFMDKTRQWNKNSHAYRSNHNTMTALLQITDYLADTADMNMIGNMMIVDQSAAFKCVDHIILDTKMARCNFSENTRRWMRDYKMHRTLFVSIGAHRSTMRLVKRGLPQGSVLAPTLFTM